MIKSLFNSGRKNLFLFEFIGFSLGFFNKGAAQTCSVCTACTTVVNNCTFAVNANSSQNYSTTANSGGRMCINAGTYTGNITITGGNNTIVVVVQPGAVFAPASITYGVFINGSFTLEVKQGGTAILPPWALAYNGSVNIRNCGTIHCLGELLLPGAGTGNGNVTIQNNGIFTVAGTLKLGTNGGRTICNSDSMHLGSLLITGNITRGVNNNGYIEVDSNWTINGTAVSDSLCPGSLIRVKGNWNDNSRTFGGNCAKVEVWGNSVCNGCRMNGVWDFCDTTGAAASKFYPTPKVDTVKGFNASWAPGVTYCTNCVPPLSFTVALGGADICSGSCYTLKPVITGGVAPFTYSWTPSGATTATVSVCPTVTTTYTVNVTDASGATGVASATVTVKPAPVVNMTHTKGLGCDSNTIYTGYGLDSMIITANTVSGNIVAYQWFLNGTAIPNDTTQSITIFAGGVYHVVAIDSNGCVSDTAGTGILIKVVDVRCGHNGNKITICHVPDCRTDKQVTICIGAPAVPAHLKLHDCDCLGPCSTPHPNKQVVDVSGMAVRMMQEETEENHHLQMSIYPNPFTNQTTLQFFVAESGQVRLELRDLKGTFTKILFDNAVEGDSDFNINVDGSSLAEGIYIATLSNNNEVMHRKLIVIK